MTRRRKLDRSRVRPLSVDDAAALSLLAPRRPVSWPARMLDRFAAPLPGVDPIDLGELAAALLVRVPARMVHPSARAALELFAALGETRADRLGVLRAWFHLAGVPDAALRGPGWSDHAGRHRKRCDREAEAMEEAIGEDASRRRIKHRRKPRRRPSKQAAPTPPTP